MTAKCLKTCFTLNRLFKEGNDYRFTEAETKALNKSGAISHFYNQNEKARAEQKAAKAVANAKTSASRPRTRAKK